MKNKLFSLLLIFLFILGIGIFVLPQNDVSFQEQRYLNKNDSISIRDLVFTSEKVLNDQFYFRESIVKNKLLLDTTLNTFYGKNAIDNISIVSLNDDINRLNDDYLSFNALEYSESELQSAADHGYNINKFDEMFPDIKTYIYKCTRIEELINTTYPFQEKCWDEMLGQLNKSIKYSKLKIKNIEDFQKYYFKTDRHWNSVGSYQGYVDVINMINKDFNVGNPKKIVSEVEYPFEYYGEFVRKTGLSGISDHIIDYELEDIGSFDYYVDDKLCNFYENRDKYAVQGNDTQVNDYEYYFGFATLTKLFDFHNEERPNLLILSTSYANANSLWIASHFNKTLLLDLRCRPEGSDFSIKYYLDEYDVDLVLLETSYETLFINGFMYIPLD